MAGVANVIFLRSRRIPVGHDGITDKLIHGAVVAQDIAYHAAEVGGQHLQKLLRRQLFAQGREVLYVGEKDRDRPPLSARFRRELGAQYSLHQFLWHVFTERSQAVERRIERDRLVVEFARQNDLTREQRSEVWAWAGSLPWDGDGIELYFDW